MWGMSDNGPEGIGATSFSYAAFEQLRRNNHELEDFFAFKDVGGMNATIDGNAQILQGEWMESAQDLRQKERGGEKTRPPGSCTALASSPVTLQNSYRKENCITRGLVSSPL